MMQRGHRDSVVTDTALATDPPVIGVTAPVPASAAPEPVRHIRRLRVTAWMLRRLLRDPRRMPGAWRAATFGNRVDRVRVGILPIRSLAALADSYAREHATDDPAVRLAYGMRWLELSAGLDERPWRLHCTPPAH
jgi:hypothetical protein